MPVKIHFPIKRSQHPELRRLESRRMLIEENRTRLDDLRDDPCQMKRR